MAELNLPHTTVVLAMTVDGKIADRHRHPANFGSQQDYNHLEAQVAAADGVLVGAATLRSGGTAMTVRSPKLLEQRQEEGKPSQPAQVICTRTGDIDPQLRFFSQSVPHWLITTPEGAKPWLMGDRFEEVFTPVDDDHSINWTLALSQLKDRGIHKLAVLGGGEIIATLFEANLINELWLTICPRVFGGKNAPTPVEGIGFSQDLAPYLKLLSTEVIDDEIFLHYAIAVDNKSP
jgi:5-amino-6-(5-phosphoribosylamino)uracil reductase